ncbi:ankyrin repeat domain-containing protein [bacterium]|nr:ankyrin repeat domain-containing protein [bacterium]
MKYLNYFTKMTVDKWFDAIEKHDYNTIKYYIKKGFDINVLDTDCEVPQSTGKNNALHLCNSKKDNDIAKLLIKSRININLRNSSGWTPLMFFCLNCNSDLVIELIKNGADMNIQPKGIKNNIHIFGRYDVQDAICEYQPENVNILKDITLPEIIEKYEDIFNMNDIGLF